MRRGLQLPSRRSRPTVPVASGPARLAPQRPSRLVHPRRGRPARPRPVPARLPRRRARPSRLRPQDPAGRAAVRLRHRGALLSANQTPDHVTIARFRVRHQQALAGFLVASLRLCAAAAGLVKVGTVALDGTKVAANAANTASRTLDKLEAQIAEILQQAAETDQREDQLFGAARGDELPEALASKAGRLARLRQAKAQLEAEAA